MSNAIEANGKLRRIQSSGKLPETKDVIEALFAFEESAQDAEREAYFDAIIRRWKTRICKPDIMP